MSTSHRFLIFACYLFLIAACASKSIEESIELPAKQDRTVSIPFVTNRNLSTGQGKSAYLGDLRGSLAAGECNVEVRGTDALDRKADFMSFDSMSMKELTEQLTRRLTDRLIVYVHGYNVDFEKGCRRAAMLKDRLGLGNRVLLFSWPADGRYLTYTRDVADLEWSIPDLQKTLVNLSDHLGAENVDLVGHSLGARGLFNTLVRISSESDTPMFNELVLIAPDIDAELFARDARRVTSVAGHTTVYVSANDRALRISREVHGYPRLGQPGEFKEQTPEFSVVDVSRTGIYEISGHLYHLHNPAVLKDLSTVLGGTGHFATAGYNRQSTGRKNHYLLEPIE